MTSDDRRLLMVLVGVALGELGVIAVCSVLLVLR